MRVHRLGSLAASIATLACLSGCLGSTDIVNGGTVDYRPLLLMPDLPLPAKAQGRIAIGAGQSANRADDVTLQGSGLVRQSFDDSLQPFLDGVLRLNENWSLGVALEPSSYGLRLAWHRAGPVFDLGLHFGAALCQIPEVRYDSVYSGGILGFGASSQYDTMSAQATTYALDGGVTLTAFPRSLVRPWVAWAITSLGDPGMSNDLDSKPATGGTLQAFTGGLACGGREGLMGWGGGGQTIAVTKHAHAGWTAFGGVGWGF